MKRFYLSSKIIYTFLFFNLACYADVSFVSAGINSDNEIIFSVKAAPCETYSYETLFLHSLETNKTEQLTFFPEKIQSLDNGKILQIANRFGVVRIDSDGEIKKKLDFNPFNSSNGGRLGILKSLQPSNNGKWVTFIEPYSPVYGKLILFDFDKERSYVLAEKVPRDSVPVLWAPDSGYFFYEDNGEVYFARPEWFTVNSIIDKQYRKLHANSVKNISHLSSSSFTYFINGAVYKVSASELFARSFYGGLLNHGKLIGKIPIHFDPAFDEIFISPDSSKAVFIHNKRNVYVFEFAGDDYSGIIRSNSIPYLLLPGNTVKTEVYWKRNMQPVVFSSGISSGDDFFKAWEMNISQRNFQKINIPEKSKFLSADKNFTKIALSDETGVSFFSVQSWQKINSFIGDKIVCASWKDSETILLGGCNSIIEYSLSKNLSENKSAQKHILISSVETFLQSKNTNAVFAKSNYDSEAFLKYIGNLKWTTVKEDKLTPLNTANSSYRIYIDSANGYFKNMIYARSLLNAETKPIFYEPFFSFSGKIISAAVRNNSSIFSNGSRNGKKAVAIIFDAIDNLDGIAQIIHTLKKYEIHATFFINGEALTRNPEAIKEIVKAGHQCGSLFFTDWDFSSAGYRIDESFIKQGLARNEDLFFSVTGSELSLIWHSPFYVSSPLIIRAGKSAGYTFIAPDISIPDWIGSSDRYSVPSLYKTSEEIINDIISSVQPGSIIPIRLGKTDSGRKDYLYMRLELLINAIMEKGFSVVNISELMKK